MTTRRSILAAALAMGALTTLGLAACSTGSTAKGTSYKWAFNHLSASLPVSIDDAFSATEAVIKDQGLTIKESAKDAFGGRIVATGVKDLRYLAELKKTGEKVTEITFTIGSLGDETRSREMMNLVERKLGL